MFVSQITESGMVDRHVDRLIDMLNAFVIRKPIPQIKGGKSQSNHDQQTNTKDYGAQTHLTRANYQNTNPSTRVQIVIIAVVSRLFVVAFAIICNLLIPDHNANVKVYAASQFGTSSAPSILQTFTRWDSAQFLTIAEYGYGEESSHAFFPLWPNLLRVTVDQMGTRFLDWMTYQEQFVFVGVVLANVCFVFATIALYELGILVMNDSRISFHSCILLCLNPANIFMTTTYSESLYMATSFTGLFLLLHSRAKSDFSSFRASCKTTIEFCGALVFLAAASATRSVGLTNGIIATWPLVCWGVTRISLPVKPKDQATSTTNLGVEGCVLGAVVVATWGPLMWHDMNGVAQFCGGISTTGEPPLWCTASAHPSLYAHVQRKYWNVGPFLYWELKQIPNFILVFPVVIIGVDVVVAMLKHVFERFQSIQLALPKTKQGGLRRFTKNIEILATVLTPKGWGLTSHVLTKSTDATTSTNTSSSSRMIYTAQGTRLPLSTIPYVAVWVALTVAGVVVYNVQVTTRVVFASCPAIYWHLSLLLLDPQTPRQKKRLIVMYLGVYNVLGPLLHCNFLPWT
eukprot:m.196728 g.196728  ORF g.196728 m.196728 type:complete len:571 (+) comp32631_c0_seq3:180-1892(+)